MHDLNSSATHPSTPIRRMVWDLTYACPLRCVHCLSESGRRASNMLGRDDALRVADVIAEAKPIRLSIGGGEPLLVPWWEEATKRIVTSGVPVTIFTSGWFMNELLARRLSESVTGVSVSVDGPNPEVHDAIRGREGSFRNSMRTLEFLNQVKRERTERGERCYEIGVEYTVTQSGWDGKEDFVEEVTSQYPEIDYVTFGAVIPEGLAQEESFTSKELLSDEQLEALSESEAQLASRAQNDTDVSVTDVRCFLPTSPLSAEGETIAHIEASGQLRASTNYEAKVGSVLDEPLDVLWQRALAWRNDPFVAQERGSIQDLEGWARVTRVLDRRYGSDEDKKRLAQRGTSTRRTRTP